MTNTNFQTELEKLYDNRLETIYNEFKDTFLNKENYKIEVNLKPIKNLFKAIEGMSDRPMIKAEAAAGALTMMIGSKGFTPIMDNHISGTLIELVGTYIPKTMEEFRVGEFNGLDFYESLYNDTRYSNPQWTVKDKETKAKILKFKKFVESQDKKADNFLSKGKRGEAFNELRKTNKHLLELLAVMKPN